MEQEVVSFVSTLPVKEEGTFFFESNDSNFARNVAKKYCEQLNGVLINEVDGASLKMEEVKKDLQQCFKSHSNIKFYIIYNAHNLRSDVYNSMLKSLEEPIHTIYILISPGFLPPTLLSRSIHFTLRRDIVDENMGWEEIPQLLNSDEICWGKVRSALKSLFISELNFKDKISLSEQISEKFFKEKKLVKKFGEEVVKAKLLSKTSGVESIMDCKPFFTSGSNPNLAMFYTLFKS